MEAGSAIAIPMHARPQLPLLVNPDNLKAASSPSTHPSIP
jgi:hypothetical protein